MARKKKGKAAAKGPRKRGRFKIARDAQDQLDQIERAQSASRLGKNPAIIDSIEKSRQRFRNSLRKIQSLDDAYEQFNS